MSDSPVRADGERSATSPTSAMLWVAKAVTEVLGPVPVVAVVFSVLGLHASGWHASGLGYASVLVLFTCVIPYAIVLRKVRAGTVTDRHIRRREQRRVPMFIGCASTVVGLVGAAALGAPRELIAAGIAVFAAALVATVVNGFWWKLSAHAAAAASCMAVLVLVFGPWLLLTAAGVAVNGWSRVYLRVHTRNQVVVGAIVGALTAGFVFAVLR